MSLAAQPKPAITTVFAGSNFVLAGEGINPAAFKATWLFQSGIFKPEEISDAPIITPPLIIVPTLHFQFLAAPNRVQVQFLSENENDVLEPLERIISGVIKFVPALPVTAIGINFDFFTAPSDDDFAKWNRETFECAGAAASYSPESHPRFGAYFSMNFESFRMKVDVKPIKGAQHPDPKVIETLRTRREWMHFTFNFHQDIDPASLPAHASNAIGSWREASKFARSILERFTAK